MPLAGALYLMLVLLVIQSAPLKHTIYLTTAPIDISALLNYRHVGDTSPSILPAFGSENPPPHGPPLSKGEETPMSSGEK